MTPAPGLDLFYEIMQERFRGVDASIAGQISNASQYSKPKTRHSPGGVASGKRAENDSDRESSSNSSFWSDEDDDQLQPMRTDHSGRPAPHQRQISRYLSTVNRSLLDRPSDLIADYYISQLNRSMQDSVRNVETIARDKAQMRQNRNREFIQETTSKLGRSLSAEHLYQVRKEHLRYRQPFTTPTSFTVEDVSDIYKPFVLENYKRKIAIELERRRRERQEQLMGNGKGFILVYHRHVSGCLLFISGIGSPPMYASNGDLGHAIKFSQPPILEIPVIPVVERRPHSSNLSRTSILRTNEPGRQSIDSSQHSTMIIVPTPVVTQTRIPIGRAHRTMTDDGSADVVHHIGITSPPAAFVADKTSPSRIRTTMSTSVTERYEEPHIVTVPPSDFKDRERVYVRQERAKSNIIPPMTDELIDGALSTSQQTLLKDADYDASLRRPVQVRPKFDSYWWNYV